MGFTAVSELWIISCSIVLWGTFIYVGWPIPPTPPRLPPDACDYWPKFMVPALVEACDCAEPASDAWILPKLEEGVVEKVEPAPGCPVLAALPPTFPPWFWTGPIYTVYVTSAWTSVLIWAWLRGELNKVRSLRSLRVEVTYSVSIGWWYCHLSVPLSPPSSWCEAFVLGSCWLSAPWWGSSNSSNWSNWSFKNCSRSIF